METKLKKLTDQELNDLADAAAYRSVMGGRGTTDCCLCISYDSDCPADTPATDACFQYVSHILYGTEKEYAAWLLHMCENEMLRRDKERE